MDKKEFKIISLYEIIKSSKEEDIIKLKISLNAFKCFKNPEEEDFLQNKSIIFENENLSRTFLVYKESILIGYFSLGLKSLDLDNNIQSNRIKKLLKSRWQSSSSSIAAYLIGFFQKVIVVNQKTFLIYL